MTEPIERYVKGKNAAFKYALGDVGIYPKMFHSHYEIFFLLAGNVEYVSELGRTFIPPNTLVTVPCGTYHQFLVSKDVESYERCVVEIEPSFHLTDLFSDVLCAKQPILLSSESRIPEAFSLLREYADKGEGDLSHLLDAVVSELLFLLKHENRGKKLTQKKPEPLLAETMEYIRRNVSCPISLKTIADALFVSASTLSHSFKSSYGISVMQYVQSVKMAMARRLIREGYPPGEVCDMCAYGEYSTFWRAYVKQFGLSPTEEKNRV